MVTGRRQMQYIEAINPIAARNNADILQAFVQEVEAQAGKLIEADHAVHMVHHAEMVIEALAGQ